jgi:AcrR family transcriptional regulator
LPRARKAPEQRRKELVDAAGRVFMEKGYAAATVSDITREAGTAHGTFYVYFDGKEDVFDAVAYDRVAEVYQAVAEIADTPGMTALEKITEILRVNSEPGLNDWWGLQEFNKPHLLHVLARVAQRTAEMFLPVLAGVISEAVEEGSIDVPSPEATATFLIGAGLVQREALKGTESLSSEDWNRAFEDFAARVLGLKD